ncbi:NIPSNAP family protein [Agrobacterium sp. LAD9]|uniref:NIPSNAP family protein n=1 Tax=Agrobacterium sp. LAD9 TaxID=2055153 RepID=UPI000D1E2419|nr:NIPSNAP family protein [Agrobacterium sp. LAD9]
MLYELRTYTAIPGRLPDLLNRFQTITLGIWQRHGIRQVGFWTVQIGDSNQHLFYMLQWDSLAERERIWNGFMRDPEWLSRRAETEKNGPLVASVVNAILEPTAFSALQ